MLLRVNQHFFYKYQALPHYDHNNGNDNLDREASVGGIRFNGYLPSDTALAEQSELSNEDKHGIVDSLLYQVTDDRALHHWARYNAHLDGPIADCLANFQKIFMELCQVNFRMENGKGSRCISHLQSVDGDPTHLVFKTCIVFIDAMRVDPDSMDLPEVYTFEESSEESSDESSPVAVYEAAFEVKKLSPETFSVEFTEENAICHHPELEKHFKTVSAFIGQYTELEQFIDSIQNELLAYSNVRQGTYFEGWIHPSIWYFNDEVTKLVSEYQSYVKHPNLEADYKALSQSLFDGVCQAYQTHLNDANRPVEAKCAEQVITFIRGQMKFYDTNAERNESSSQANILMK